MGNENNRWWHGVPWGWVLGSAYCTALVCVGVSQVTGRETALAALRDYQTLVAGLATVAALFMAAQQLKRQNKRDVVDAIRHHEAEIDAMAALDKEAHALSIRATGLASMFGPSTKIGWDETRWGRLQQEAHVSLSGAIARLRMSVRAYNDLIPDPFSMGFLGHGDTQQLREATRQIQYACRTLATDIEQRRKIVLQLIRATT